MVDIVCCVTVVCRALSPLQGFCIGVQVRRNRFDLVKESIETVPVMQPVSISNPRLWDFMCLIDERSGIRVFVARVAATAACVRCIQATYAASLVCSQEAVVSGGSRPVLNGTCFVAARCVGVGQRPPPCASTVGRRVYKGSDRSFCFGGVCLRDGPSPTEGFGGVPSPRYWSTSDATPLAALVAGDICGQRILAGTPSTLPCRVSRRRGSPAPCWRGSAEAGCWVP